jgi:hypothetical protein
MLHPLMYQINTRAFLGSLAAVTGAAATLDDVPDAAIEAIARRGFTWVWLLSVWQLGPAGRDVALARPGARAAFSAALPDYTDADIGSSGFAIVDYEVARDLGGPDALARLRSRFARRGIKLMLDFVPNHMALDAAWLADHPDYFIHGTPVDLKRAPQNYVSLEIAGGSVTLARGRDPNYDGWPDTLQLNYANPSLQQAQRLNLLDIAEQCDGVRCDMAMLLLPDVFERTWGVRPEPFWPVAIGAVKREHPAFTFMAEVYWDLESTLLDQGFDFAYDKRLYDRLREGTAGGVRDHLGHASLAYQSKLVRFLENHDEPRAASAFEPPKHEAAAVITYLAPGMRFFCHGQFEGARVRVPVEMLRAPAEPVDTALQAFYERLLAVLSIDAFHVGDWEFVEPVPAWAGEATFERFVAFAWQVVPYAWEQSRRERILVAVNFSPEQSRCRLRVPFTELGGRAVVLTDLMGDERYERDGSELIGPGLFVELAPWRYNVFRIEVSA